jgi:NAD(P)H-flavin reductase
LVRGPKSEVRSLMSNPYYPHVAVIREIRDEGPGLKSFDLAFRDEGVWETFSPQPGQFVELSVFGEGESPFGVATAPSEGRALRLSVQAVGRLTNALHGMSPGDEVGVRGPFGNGWPLEEAKGRNLVLIGGGIGLPPIRSALVAAMARKSEYESISLFYGARSIEHVTYADEIRQWTESGNARINVTVDVGCDEWKGHVGVITTLLEDVAPSPKNAVSMTCGPPIMIHFVVPTLEKLGFEPDQIIVSLEAKMKCGIGKCGRCNLGAEYICLDGPVFDYRHLSEKGVRL